MLHYAYGIVNKFVETYVTCVGGYVIEVPLPFPINFIDEIVQEFRKVLGRGKQNDKRSCSS